MTNFNNLTITIITYKRPKQLRRCLSSLVKQSIYPGEILIVDNDKNFSAKKVIDDFNGVLPIRYVQERKQGVPFARNRALRECKTSYLGFIDDDCVVMSDWTSKAGLAVKKHPKISYFVGWSGLLNQNKSAALAQFIRYNYWFKKNLLKNNETSPFNLDTKNIIFKIDDLKKKSIFFGKTFSIGVIDAADTELGFQLARAGLRGKYIKSMKINHEEEPSPFLFLKKMYLKGKISFHIAKKWKLENEFIDREIFSHWNFIKSIRHWPSEYKKYFGWNKNNQLLSFLLIKLCDKIFVHGFMKEAK